MSSILSKILDNMQKKDYIFSMNVAKRIEEKINKIEEGDIFTYKDLLIKKEEYFAASKTIERLIKKEIIKRISTGTFYKPKKTIFGELRPNEEKIITPYLFKDGKRIAYITGLLLYNKMGLTTQVPRVISIASREKRIYISRGNIKANAVKSYVEVTEENFQYLQILDAIKDFKKIPDLDLKNGIKILSNILKKLSKENIEKLVNYSLSYPPRVRALLGAILEEIGRKENLEKLQNSLNPFSVYKLGITKEILPTAENWKIK